jgi:hypothetical protein
MASIARGPGARYKGNPDSWRREMDETKG